MNVFMAGGKKMKPEDGWRCHADNGQVNLLTKWQ